MKRIALVVLMGILLVTSCGLKEDSSYDGIRCEECNVILISIDTLRADRLSAYGNSRDTSPVIDAFAEKSVLFEYAFSHAPRTTESHMSIMTSLYPVEHGVGMYNVEHVIEYGPDEIQWRPLSAEIPILAEVLNAEGYSTYAYTGGWAVDGRYGFERGFDEYHTDVDMMSFIDFDDSFGTVLEQSDDGKFFLFLHTYQTHWPYTPVPDIHELLCAQEGLLEPTAGFSERILTYLEDNPESETSHRFTKYIKRYAEGSVPYPPALPEIGAYDSVRDELLAIKDMEHSSEKVQGMTDALRKLPDPDLIFDILSDFVIIETQTHLWDGQLTQYFSCLYDAEIREMDILFERLLENLEQNGLSENTLIIFTSDHGEEFYEHEGYNHNWVYREIVHVPLIVFNPAHSVENVRVSTPVALVDVFPTILDVLDLPALEFQRGRSLVPALAGETLQPLPVFINRVGAIEQDVVFEITEEDHSLVNWPYHLIWRNPESIQVMSQFTTIEACSEQIQGSGWFFLFNIEDDLSEQVNLADSGEGMGDVLDSMVRVMCEHIGDAYVFHTENSLGSYSEMPDEQAERLRSLGYLG